MATMRQAAQQVLDTARDEIGWIVLWKDGRGWDTSDFWPDFDEKAGTLTFEDYHQEELQKILAKDPNAIVVNSYYDNLGSTEEMTRNSLANALRWQYELQNSRLVDYLKIKQEDTPMKSIELRIQKILTELLAVRKQALFLVMKNEETMKAALTDTQKEQLENLSDRQSELTDLLERRAFAEGFRLAVKIMVDVMITTETPSVDE